MQLDLFPHAGENKSDMPRNAPANSGNPLSCDLKSCTHDDRSGQVKKELAEDMKTRGKVIWMRTVSPHSIQN